MFVKWKEQLLTLTPYQPGKSIDAVKRQYGLENIVKLASNENPFGCSKKVIAALYQHNTAFPIYPDGYATNLRDTVAAAVKLKPEQLIFGNGSDEIIQIIARALLRPGTNTIMATPSFSQYRHNAVIEGAEYREIPLVEGQHDLQRMLNAIDEQTTVIWLCSPNNPTGTYIPKNTLISFLDQVPNEILVVLDEAYHEYVDADDYYDAIKLLDQYSNLIVLRTFSKIYGLASLRVGYGMSSPTIIRHLEPAREPFNVNSLAQVAAIAAIGDQQFVQSCKQKNREGLQMYYDFCERNGLHYYPSQGNFILIDFGVDGNTVFQYLMEKGFIVRSGVPLGFPTSVRVTVGSQQQVSGVIEVMEQFLAQSVSAK